MKRFLLLAAVLAHSASAKTSEYNLTIAEEQVNITGKPTTGMIINGGIPGPTLRKMISFTGRPAPPQDVYFVDSDFSMAESKTRTAARLWVDCSASGEELSKNLPSSWAISLTRAAGQ